MTTTPPKPNRFKPFAATVTGLALIAILSGFAMGVMPLLSTAGKAAAVFAASGFAVTLLASVLQAWRPASDIVNGGLEHNWLHETA